jgi:multisubunit Na+/H+ antiporter MnhB subunit
VTLVAALDVLLAVSLLAVAAATIAARDAFAAAVGFVALGLLLTLVWVRIAAPDVALTEAAIGSGVTGGLLVAASSRLRRGAAPAQPGQAPGIALRLAAAAACALLTAGLAAIVLSLPEPAPTLAPLAVAHLAQTGLGNPVTAVLMAYRAIDTLLEVVVLLLAVIGIWSLAPDRFWHGRPGLLQREDRHGVLVFFARLLPPLGILVGIHLFWVGSDAPGGEFQSATVLAAMWILAMMAGLVDAPPISGRRLRLLLVAGPLVFLAVGFAGLAMAGSFLAYPPDHAKLVIVAIEVPVTLSIAAMLGLLVAGPPARAPDRHPPG